MLKFELNGIKVEIGAKLEHNEYTDANHYKHTRFERKMEIRILFWELIISGNLQDLSLIKSSLSYFMQGYWKRSGKEAGKIDLVTKITKYHPHGYKKNFLHVSLEKDGLTQHEVYLDGQQVLMLDVAIGKALSFLSPEIAQ